ncbi:MAG: M50 family metallopeptidase [Chloroflexota bacterium]|nr:M50 family metallopeptidase [Dehalococcoidia bacterium]MDW8252330.1 M50 family metallopeptidase [Chloroflexota bacterium]
MDFGLLSLLYAGAALYTLIQLARGWRGLLAEEPTPGARSLASLTAFLLLTPPAVYLHELGHAAAVLLTGAQLRGIGFFLYWGYTAYAGRVTPSEQWLIAAAGPLVTLTLGWGAIAVGLRWPIRPAINQLILVFGMLQLLQILVFYPLLTLANLGELAGSDFAVLYSPATPGLALAAGVVHGVSLVLLIAGSRWPAVRRRYARITGGSAPSAPPPPANPASVYAAVLAGRPVPEPDPDAPPAEVPQILSAARALVTDRSDAARLRADAAFAADERGVAIRQALEAVLAESRGKNAETLYDQARALLVATEHIGTAKYALALLTLFGQPADVPIFERFARDPAFTRIAVSGLATALGSLDEAGRRLLPQLEGLAKVELVELLASAPTPAMRRLLVTSGLAPGYEGYSALTIARAARLAEILATAPDPTIVDGAGALLAALAHDAVVGGPDGTLAQYEDAAVTLERYLALTAERRDLTQLLRLELFRAALAEPGIVDEGQRPALLATVQSRLSDPGWAAVAERAIAEAATPAARRDALTAARAIGRPTVEECFRWLALAEPDELAGLLRALGDQIAEDDAARFVAAAAGRLQPAGETTPWEIAHALTVALDIAARFPAAGGPLLTLALAGPVTTRTKALAVLERWPAAARAPFLAAVGALAEHDPAPSVRSRARELLARTAA